MTAKNKTETYLTPYIKIKSKRINYSNTRSRSIKILEENVRVTPYDLVFNNVFLNMTPKIPATKGKIDVRFYQNLLFFHQSTQSREWEKYLQHFQENGKNYLQII